MADFVEDLFRFRDQEDGPCSAALDDGLFEQAAGARRTEQTADGHAAGRLPHDSYPVRITPECFDIVADPCQCRDLVEETKIGGSGVTVRAEVAKSSQPVVGRDVDEIAPHGIVRAI